MMLKQVNIYTSVNTQIISTNIIKSSKTQLCKIGQSRGFLGRLLVPLLKTGLPLMKNVL